MNGHFPAGLTFIGDGFSRCCKGVRTNFRVYNRCVSVKLVQRALYPKNTKKYRETKKIIFGVREN